MAKSIGNVRNFTKTSTFRSFYLKLTKKNKKYLLSYSLILALTTLLIIIFWPQSPIYGPSALSDGVKTELSKTECIEIEKCSANTAKNPSDKVLKINLPINSPISVMGIDEEGQIVKEIKIVNDIFWKVSVSKSPMLLTITQNYNRYQIIVK